MPAKSASGFKACCAAVTLLLLTAHAAEPVSPLIGATREQVLTRYGEPKSQIVAGNRIVMLYARERVVLRDGVVIDVELISADPVRRPEPAPAPGPVPGTGAPAPTGPAPAPTNPPATTPGQPPTSGTPPAPVVAPNLPPPADPEPKVEIKLVRPPGSTYSRPPPTKQEASTSPSTRAANPSPAPEPVAPRKFVPVAPTPDPAELARAAEQAADTAAKNKRAKAASSAVRRLDFADGSEADESSATLTYVLVVAALVGGGGFLIWRRRQRQLDLAATSVANTPLKPQAVPPAGAEPAPAPRSRVTVFSEDLLARLDAGRFEALVAAYYSKTGVVATRAKAGSTGPMHFAISWKGEPRPFAGVHCIVNPVGAIDAKPLREFVAALAKEDIRRGYVVTSGKFNGAAQGVAGENQLTLLPGDVFIGKLNALPESARSEIIQAVNGSANAGRA